MYKAIIIEDDPVMTMVNRNYLREYKQINEVIAFKRAEEGLEHVMKYGTDLILLDYHLPMLSGGDFLKELRSAGNTAEVIMITMDNEIDVASVAFSFGAMDYLIKPYSGERFRESIETFLMLAETKSVKKHLSQSDLDVYIKRSKEQVNTFKLRKGLQAETYERLHKYMKKNLHRAMKLDEMEKETGLSKVTIRRYMGFFEEQNLIRIEVNYATGGRPSLLYIMEK